jgi:hypothetical protein
MYGSQCFPSALAGADIGAGRLFNPVEKMPARGLDGGIPVVEEYTLHRQAGVAGNLCVLIS